MGVPKRPGRSDVGLDGSQAFQTGATVVEEAPTTPTNNVISIHVASTCSFPCSRGGVEQLHDTHVLSSVSSPPPRPLQPRQLDLSGMDRGTLLRITLMNLRNDSDFASSDTKSAR